MIGNLNFYFNSALGMGPYFGPMGALEKGLRCMPVLQPGVYTRTSCLIKMVKIETVPSQPPELRPESEGIAFK